MKRASEQLLKETLTLILAGGQGERLYPLTKIRSKPSVPFAGIYRIIDFTLSNCLNSGLRQIYVLTQYKSLTLDQHIKLGWHIFNVDLGEFIYSVPPQQISSERWYLGTADAVYQNVYLLERHRPEVVFVLSGDHIYKMDYFSMLEDHLNNGAEFTVASVEIDKKQAGRFGIIEVDERSRIIGFQEKPTQPKTLPHDPQKCLANMGVYLFNTNMLVKAVIDDAKRDSQHDFGKNVIPQVVKNGNEVYAYNFREASTKRPKYWRDIGTIDSYYEASMDLLSADPLFELLDPQWPLRTYQRQSPPAKTIPSNQTREDGVILDALISPGCLISGGRVERSILSYHVRVDDRAHVADSILMRNVSIGTQARIRKCIIDEGVAIAPNTEIGYDPEQDAKRFSMTESGIVVVPTGIKFE